MGSQGSSSSSAPLTAKQRLETYSAGANNVYMDSGGNWQSGAGLVDNLPTEGYKAPTQMRLTDGDYNRLQSELTSGYTAPIDRAKSLDLERSNQDAADRGIFTSMNALRLNNDVNERYIPQYAKAGADATNARFNLQSGENTAGNAFNIENAKQINESNWRPADYKAGLWNGTSGVISSGNTSGWSI